MNMKAIKNYIIERLNAVKNIKKLTINDIKEIVSHFLNAEDIISVKDNGKMFIVELSEEALDENFDIVLSELENYFIKNYNIDVGWDYETECIEIYKKKYIESSPIKVDNNQDDKIDYSNMSIKDLKKKLIGKLLLTRDKLYGDGFDDGKEIIDIIKRGSNIFIEYMDGTIHKELNVKMLDQNDSPYYEFKISTDKVSKAEQRAEERERHKVQKNGLTQHDEEIIDLAYSTTYKRDKNKYLKAVDTDKARKIIEYIFSDMEIEWEN